MWGWHKSVGWWLCSLIDQLSGLFQLLFDLKNAGNAIIVYCEWSVEASEISSQTQKSQWNRTSPSKGSSGFYMERTVTVPERRAGRCQLQPGIVFWAHGEDFTLGLTDCWVNLVQFCTVALYATPTSNQIADLTIPPEKRSGLLKMDPRAFIHWLFFPRRNKCKWNVGCAIILDLMKQKSPSPSQHHLKWQTRNADFPVSETSLLLSTWLKLPSQTEVCGCWFCVLVFYPSTSLIPVGPYLLLWTVNLEGLSALVWHTFSVRLIYNSEQNDTNLITMRMMVKNQSRVSWRSIPSHLVRSLSTEFHSCPF